MTPIRPDRPLAVTLVGWLFVCVGCATLAYGIWRYAGSPAGGHHVVDLTFVVVSAFAAAVGGAFTLRGRNWARWLLVGWMGAHVLLSLGHSAMELAVHAVLFAAVLAALVNPRASSYFGR